MELTAPLGAAYTVVLTLATVIANEGGQKAPALSPGFSLPSLEGENLLGKRISLPEEARGRVSLLVFTLIIDRESRVRWLFAGSCDEAGLRLLVEQLKSLLPEAAVMAN